MKKLVESQLANDMFTEEYFEAIKDKSKWSKNSEDEPICAICGKRVINDVPLRLWNQEEDYIEIAFHIDCAMKK